VLLHALGSTHVNTHQWVRTGFDPFAHLITLEKAEIMPGRHSDTRIKPLPLANGHNRHIPVTPERKLVSVGEWPLHVAVINLQPFQMTPAGIYRHWAFVKGNGFILKMGY
jgi:hypothetical protein